MRITTLSHGIARAVKTAGRSAASAAGQAARLVHSAAAHSAATAAAARAAAVLVLTLALASCAATDELDTANNPAGNPNAYLTLTTASVEGLTAAVTRTSNAGTNNAGTRTISNAITHNSNAITHNSNNGTNTISNAGTRTAGTAATRTAATRKPGTPVSNFVDGDVIEIWYDFDGNFDTTSDQGTAYARLTGNVWTLYSDLELTTVAKLRPNPDNLAESWEKLWLKLSFHPLGIVERDGKKVYETYPYTYANGAFTYHDMLFATGRSTTPGAPAAGQYSVSPDGQITASFRHNLALLALPETAINVSQYPEAYSGITALTGTIVFTNADGASNLPETITFIQQSATEAGSTAASTGTWQAIAPAAETYTLTSLTATLSKDNAEAKVTAIVTNAVPLRFGTRYPLRLTLTPDKSLATITGAIPGWGTNDEGMESDAFEGKDYTLATPGDKASHWTIRTARGLAAFRDWVNSANDNNLAPTATPATLAANIDLKGSATNLWTPIGTSVAPYRATFDGAGHTVRGLYVSHVGAEDDFGVGLFASASASSRILNLGIEGGTVLASNSNVEGTIHAGSLVGKSGGNITACYATNVTVKTDNTFAAFVGGLVGRLEGSGSMTACYASTCNLAINDVLAPDAIGGLVAQDAKEDGTVTTVTASYTAAITATGSSLIGGFVGNKSGNIVHCATTESVGLGWGDSDSFTSSCTDLRAAVIAGSQTDIDCGTLGKKSITEIWIAPANAAAPFAPKLFWQK